MRYPKLYSHLLKSTSPMKRTSVFAIIFTILSPLGSYAQYASSSKAPKKAGDLIESTSYNDHKRGTPRALNTCRPARILSVLTERTVIPVLSTAVLRHGVWKPAIVRYLPLMSRMTAVISVFVCACRMGRLHRWKRPLGARLAIIRVAAFICLMP